MELCEYTATEQARLVRTKQVSALELTRAALEHIHAVDGRPGTLDGTELPEDREHIHAFTYLCEDEALRRAEEIDRRIAAGEAVGPLAGVPYSAKDVYCTRAIPTSAGSRILRGWRPPYDAAVIERLNAADAVLIGKTNCDEFGFGGSNETSAYRPLPRNPRALDRVPGGSSGGSAAAAAACEGAFSLGTDTGGSIREPAAFCGVTGLKPTYGRVSRYGVTAFSSSMDCVGPLTRSAEDAALIMNAIAGEDPRDNTAARVPVPDYTADLKRGVKGMRVGISPDFLRVPEGSLDPEIASAVERTAETLRGLGAEIVEDVPMPNTEYAMPAYFVISRIEAYSNLQRYDGLRFGYTPEGEPADMNDLYRRARGEGFGYQAKLRLLTGMFISQSEFYEKYYRRALRARALMRRDYDAVFDPAGKYRLDALLTPTAPCPAFPFMGEAERDSLRIQMADCFTTPMNFAGTPAVSVPAGTNAAGLPIGVQLAGYDWREAELLRLAYALEEARS